MTEKFDFEQALEALKAGRPITGKDSVLSPLCLFGIKAMSLRFKRRYKKL